MGFAKAVMTAIAFVSAYWKDLIRALLIPFLLFIISGIVSDFVVGDMARFSLNLLDALLQTMILVRIHQLVLLGPQAVPYWSLNWSWHESRFLLHMFLLSLLLVLVFFVALYISAYLALPGIVTLLMAALIASLLVSRIYLVFPAIAIGQKMRFRDAWMLTSQHKLLMYLVTIIFPILASLPALVMVFIPYLEYLAIPVLLLSFVLSVTVISVAYRMVTEQLQAGVV